MGQGAIEYRGQLMSNCRESYLSNIGDALQLVVLQAPFQRFLPLADSWIKEVSEMPPGCSTIRLDEHVPDQEALESFVAALRATLPEFGNDKPGTREVVQQLLIFLLQGYECMEPVYRGKKVEPQAAPNGGPAASTGDSGHTPAPPPGS